MRWANWMMFGMLVLMVGFLPTSAQGEQSGFSLWPFGGDEEVAHATPQSSSMHEEHPWYMPSLALPSLPAPRRPILPGIRGDNPRPLRERLAAPVTNGAHYMADGTRRAWNATRETFSWSDTEESPQLTRRERLPVWKRMLGQEEEAQGPQTVVEWMAQDRLNP